MNLTPYRHLQLALLVHGLVQGILDRVAAIRFTKVTNEHLNDIVNSAEEIKKLLLPGFELVHTGIQRFQVVEHASGFSLLDTETKLTHWLSDGVDAVANPDYDEDDPESSMYLSPGTPGFCELWATDFNTDVSSTLEAYFPAEYAKLVPRDAELNTMQAPGMTPADEQAYVASGGTTCPYCGSSQLDSDPVQADGATAIAHVVCEACEKTWTDTFQLCGMKPEDPAAPPFHLRGAIAPETSS